jgi:hypothetical protein
VKDKNEGKWYGAKKIEDHYVLFGEPGTAYLQHLILERGTGSVIADGLFNAMQEMGIAEKSKQ